MRTSLSLLIGALLSLLVVIALQIGWLAPLERIAYDLRAQHCQRFIAPPSDKIVHVDIDDASLAELGHWPWPRSMMADVIGELDAAGAKVIALDILYYNPSNKRLQKQADGQVVEIDDDAMLAAALKKCGRVILSGDRATGPGEMGVLPLFADSAAATGFVTHTLVDEGLVRKLPILRYKEGKIELGADLLAACATLGVNVDTGVFVQADSVRLQPPDRAPIVVPVTWTSSGEALMQTPFFGTGDWTTAYDWPAHQQIKQHIPIAKIYEAVELRQKLQAYGDVNPTLQKRLDQSRAWIAERIKGRTVMVGWIATGTTDFFPTAIHRACPGVVIRGTVINGIITGELWRIAPWWLDVLVTFALGLFMTWIATRTHALWTLVIGASLCIAYLLINSFVIFDWGNTIVTLSGPILAIALCCLFAPFLNRPHPLSAASDSSIPRALR